MAGRAFYFCDEISLQLLLPHYPHKLLDDRFNCSPTYGRSRDDVRIWHLHGSKHVAHDSYRRVWLPLYEECLRHNVAGLAAWAPGGDARLRQFLADAVQGTSSAAEPGPKETGGQKQA